jgi:hypothetical protein
MEAHSASFRVGAFRAAGLTISNRRRSATLLLSPKSHRRPLGARALHETDNLTHRRTRSDTTRSAPASGRFMET